MNTRQILRSELKGCSREEVAKAMGMTVGSLNNQVAGEKPYLPKGNTPNSLDRIYGLIEVAIASNGRSVVLSKLAEEFGFMLIANPLITRTETPALQQISKILKEFSALIEEVSDANADMDIDAKEADSIRCKWEIMKAKTEEFVLACETGLYGVKE